MRIDDGELVGRTLKGEWAAFAGLVDRYRDAVSGVAYHYLGHFDDVLPEYVAKEAYRVMAEKDDIWYLEHYSYLYKE